MNSEIKEYIDNQLHELKVDFENNICSIESTQDNFEYKVTGELERLWENTPSSQVEESVDQMHVKINRFASSLKRLWEIVKGEESQT